MAIIVLAVGALMVLAGAGEIYYGSGYIDIERGWSAFIAGTILLTGGLLTLAVGLALRQLGEVKSVLLHLGGLAALPAPDAGVADYALPVREPPVALRPTEGALEGPALQIEPHFGGAPLPIDAEKVPPLTLRDEVVSTAEMASPPTASAPAPSPPLASPEQAPVAHRAEPSPALDDWLDQEFVEPAHEGPHGPDARQAEPPHIPPGEALHAEPAVSEFEDRAQAEPPVEARARPVADAPSTAPALVAQPAVIGRYESDGTSYVMYADGSIEAQSEAGIYRFASMAELKAFIET